jgi:nucleoside-diphosphate-sugar epimerase
MNIPVRLVSRKPQPTTTGVESVAADLLNADAVRDAVEGCEVAYLTAGLTYKTQVWKEQWPVIMSNAINACAATGCKLVFFDNVYSYGPVNGPMTEETPEHPTAEKGKVRAQIARMLWDAVKAGQVNGMIVRSADFYGPETPLSFTEAMVFQRLRKNKAPQWMASADVLHSLTYTPDAGRATALLGNTPDAYGQLWHLPTAPAITGRAFVELANKAAGTTHSVQVLGKTMLRIVGWFVPVVKEGMELIYQSDRDYVFDSSKFSRRFPDFRITPLEEGVKACL